MNRSRQVSLFAASVVAFLLAMALSIFNARLALGAAGVGGTCAVWAVGMALFSRSSDARMQVPRAPEVRAGMPAERIEPSRNPVTARDLVIPETTEPAGVLAALFSNAETAGHAVAARLWLQDVGTPTLRLVCSAGPNPPDPTPVSALEGVVGEVLASGDTRCERTRVSAKSAEQASVWRYIVPLSTDEAAGLVFVDFAGESEPDQGQMTRVTSALRGSLMCALALHVARSEASSSRQLVDAAGDFARVTDSNGVVSTALEHALRLSNAETGSVMLLDDDGRKMHIAKAHGLPEEVVGATCVSEGEGIAGWVLATGRPLVVEDLEHRGPQSRRHGVLSAASVPISDDDGVLGVLNVGSRAFHARFSRTHVRGLEAVGRMAAVGLRSARAATRSEDLFFETLGALALSLEARDPYSRGGTARIMRIAMELGEARGLDESQSHALRLAVLLHDIGMSAAGDAVAVTNRPLTTVEWAMLKMHPRIAAEMLSQAPMLEGVIPLVSHHHERFDGNGYGDGLAGEEIPLGARILGVADAYVAMTSSRPYRSAMSAVEAIAELSANAGAQFDPGVVDALVELARNNAACLEVSSA